MSNCDGPVLHKMACVPLKLNKCAFSENETDDFFRFIRTHRVSATLIIADVTPEVIDDKNYYQVTLVFGTTQRS